MILKDESKDVWHRRMFWDPYLEAFNAGITINSSCFTCPFACEKRCSDITIGDFWGIGSESPFHKPNRKVSVIGVNSKRGFDFLNECKSLVLEKRNWSEAVAGNSQLRAPLPKSSQYDLFWEKYYKYGIDAAFKATVYKKVCKRYYKEYPIILLKSIGNLEFAKLTPGEAHFYDLNGDEIEKQTTEIKWDAEAAEKGGFEHFMMKEIHEQPKAVQDTLNSVIKNGAIDLSSVEITEDEIKNFEQIYIVACGSAWHVGMAAQYVLEDMADIPVRVELASEFRYRKMSLNQKALVIVVSQSGETADTLAALRLAKEKDITTMAVVNVVGSSIAREADKVFYTLAGPEISVATTKAYSAQLAAMYCLAVQFAKVREKITEEQYSYYIAELLTLPEKMQKTLEDKERIQWFAAKYANAHDVFFVGRGIDYAVCLEGSLKLKEISYIHSEAYAAGELKHGTISLIEQGTEGKPTKYCVG